MIGDVFDAKVRDLTSAGQGVVAHPSGMTVFVPGLWLDETARVSVTERRGRVGLGRVIEILDASPDRITPPCSHHGVGSKHCGGCAWMFVAYEAQLRAKQMRVEQVLHRLAPHLSVATIQPSEQVLGYRNRAQFKTDGKRLGYVANQSHALVPIEVCPVLTDVNQQHLQQLQQRLPNPAWRPKGRKHPWLTLDVDEQTDLANMVVNQRRPFQQGNSGQNDFMRQWLHDQLVSLDRAVKVVELFCGRGNFTEVIAALGFQHVVASEVDPKAIAALTQQQLPGVETVVIDLFDEQALNVFMAKHRDAKVLVLDPPRDGLKQRDALFHQACQIEYVVYISCDLATFNRDVQAFMQHGFCVAFIQPLDLFPQTPHVEILCVLKK